MPQLNIVLVEPEIPQNTGNISRTCAATGARLHLVEPMGFTIDDKKLKRAGLDYWPLLDVTYYKNLDDFLPETPAPSSIFPPKPAISTATLPIPTARTWSSARRPRACRKACCTTIRTAAYVCP